MISEQTIDAFNNRLTVNLNSIKTMTPAQLDRVKSLGSAAENLIKNRDFVLFVHQFKFDRTDALTEIKTHTPEDNAARIAICHQISGMDEFVASLHRAAYMKNRVVSQQGPNEI